KGAVSEAIDGLEGNAAILGGLAELHAEAFFYVADHAFATHGLAGFGAANLQPMVAGGVVPEIMGETDDTRDFGVRDVQCAGDQRDGGFVDVAELLLKSVEDRKQGTGKPLAFLNERESPVGVPAFRATHAKSPLTPSYSAR